MSQLICFEEKYCQKMSQKRLRKQTLQQLFKEWIYFFFLFVDWSIYPKKMTGNCIIARSAWCKVSVIFFRMDTSSTNKTNKFIPYHLIISKTKYYLIKRYIFHDLKMHFSFCDVRVILIREADRQSFIIGFSFFTLMSSVWESYKCQNR